MERERESQKDREGERERKEERDREEEKSTEWGQEIRNVTICNILSQQNQNRIICEQKKESIYIMVQYTTIIKVYINSEHQQYFQHKNTKNVKIENGPEK